MGSEEQFRAIFQHAAVGMAQSDLDGVILLANDQYHAMLGYAPGELIGRSFRDYTHPDDVAMQLQKLGRLLAGELDSVSIEKRYIRKDGSLLWGRLHASIVRDEGAQPRSFISVLVDITERKHAEAALRESEERFRTMADTAPVMIWVSGPDKRCTFFNKNWLTFTGRTLEQELGDGWAAGVHPDDLDRCWTTYATAFDARRAFQMEYRLRSAGGNYRWIRDEGVPRFGPDGEFAGYIGSCIDVTDVRTAHEEALARQKLESVGVLAGGIAHDFNNLVGCILSNCQLALSELPELSPIREELVRIHTVSLRAAEIVRELLAYAGRENAAFEPVDISRIVSEMLELLKVSIAKHATLRVDLARHLPAVRANAAQIRQMVMNLVTNASEAIGEGGGIITVSTCLVRALGAGSDRDTEARDCIRLQIRDTGCGMTDEVFARMFDPYFTTKFTGRGLGLAAVQGIVRGHGGTIHAVSASGRGTCIDILLPCLDEPVRETSPLPPAAKPETSNLQAHPPGTVLVIEDEGALLATIAKILTKRGFSVLQAEDGAAGVEVFRANANQVQVILLDMTLPGVSGPDVLKQLREIRPDVRVILTSAYAENTVLTAFGKEHVWGFIRKPYQMEELLSLIGEACGPRQ